MHHWAMAILLSSIAALAGAAEKAAPPAAPAPPSPAQTQRIATLCKELGKGQYGSQGACKELIAIGEPAVPALIKALKDPRPQARWWAVAALSSLATDEAYTAILDVLKNEKHSFVLSTAVYYLRHFRTKGKKDIWPHLEAALTGKDAEAARWALRLMVEDSEPGVKGGYTKLDDAFRKVLAAGASELRAYALNHIRELAETDPKKAKTYLPLVRQLVATGDPRVRYDAVHTTVALMDKGQVDFLRQVFEKDTDPIVQEGVVRCVTVIAQPPAEAIEIFLMGLDAKDEKVREVAASLIRKGCKKYFRYDHKAPLDERRSAIEQWTAWYRANRAKLQWEPDLRKFLIPGERPARPGIDDKPAAKGAP
ncbi:HEAT repeat domain-containing protein [bacterium]|nr:HEAT repeat domain-containing protein [bacterium]